MFGPQQGRVATEAPIPAATLAAHVLQAGEAERRAHTVITTTFITGALT